MKKLRFRAWIVNCRGEHDTQHALELCELGLCGNSPAEAWKKFLALVGRERKYWNKLDYIAEPLTITVAFVEEKK